jgi:hypothetical protein
VTPRDDCLRARSEVAGDADRSLRVAVTGWSEDGKGEYVDSGETDDSDAGELTSREGRFPDRLWWVSREGRMFEVLIGGRAGELCGRLIAGI